MTWHHVAALMIAATLFLACEFSGRCSDKMVDHAAQLAMAIAVATFAHAQGHAQGVRTARRAEDKGDGR